VKSDSQAVFGQVDWTIIPKLKLVVAGRGDTGSLHPARFTPKASIVYNIRGQDSIRFTFNEGFQVPNHAEFFAQADAAPAVNLSGLNQVCAAFGVDCGFGVTRVLALGNKDLKLETITTWEVGYTAAGGRRGRTRGRTADPLEQSRRYADSRRGVVHEFRRGEDSGR
jgi:outer membrane receptor protein involved in Fe transport